MPFQNIYLYSGLDMIQISLLIWEKMTSVTIVSAPFFFSNFGNHMTILIIIIWICFTFGCSIFKQILVLNTLIQTVVYTKFVIRLFVPNQETTLSQKTILDHFGKSISFQTCCSVF